VAIGPGDVEAAEILGARTEGQAGGRARQRRRQGSSWMCWDLTTWITPSWCSREASQVRLTVQGMNRFVRLVTRRGG